MLVYLEPPHKAFQNLGMLLTYKAMRLIYEKWNAKAQNTIFRGLCKDVFNRVRNHKDAHALWSDIYALYEGTKSEHEERYHLVMKSSTLLKCFLKNVLIRCIHV